MQNQNENIVRLGDILPESAWVTPDTYRIFSPVEMSDDSTEAVSLDSYDKATAGCKMVLRSSPGLFSVDMSVPEGVSVSVLKTDDKGDVFWEANHTQKVENVVFSPASTTLADEKGQVSAAVLRFPAGARGSARSLSACCCATFSRRTARIGSSLTRT